MITNYNDFLINSINESYTDISKEDFDIVNRISKIVSDMEKRYNIYVSPYSYEERKSNPSLFGKDVSTFADCFRVTQSGVFDEKFKGIQTDIYERGLKIYVKTKTYNKLKSILYGKQYVKNSGFNPLTDSTELSLITKTGVTYPTTRGNFFSEYWSDVEENCDNAVEFLLKGTIKDVLGDVTKFSVEIAALAAISAAMMTVIGASGGTAVPVIASVSVSAGTKGVYIWRIIDRFKKYIDVKRVIEIITKSWDYFVNIFRTNTGDIALNLSIYKLLEYLNSSNPNTEGDSLHKLQNPKDKITQITEIKGALEQHSDFTIPFTNSTWSKEFFYSGLNQMPGFKEWSNKTGKRTPEELQYELLWYISQYCYEYQLFCKGYQQVKTNRDAFWAERKVQEESKNKK